jgi:NADH dehydrogenase [ubiquinone] 1 alpha subcomplex assembly factor 7
MERLDRFMARANAAYYATRDPYADFTTAPEITQVFGELLGTWAAVVWEMIGRPDPVLFAEAGPGRGTLMADALRAAARVAPAFRAGLRLHLIEASPRLRARQAALLPDAQWHEHAAELPSGPLILIANEFLDALPIRQFVRRGDGWTERFVENGSFVERRTEAIPLAQPLPRHGGEGRDEEARAGEGDVLELCEPARELAAALGKRAAREGGAALFIDYGAARSTPGESLQALRHGRPADPLAEPGEADLTAHVDFQAIAEAARSAGAAVQGPVPMGPFLVRLGLFQRTDRLARGQSPARAAALVAASRRLAEPMHMGRLFKVLAVADPRLPALPGLEQT